MWESGTIHAYLGWKRFILIPKDTKDTQVIGILEFLWKVMEAIIDTCINKAVTFHDVFHVFQAGRGMGTDIREMKLVQDLEGVDQDLVFLVFLDIRKVYDNLQHGRLLKTLEGYGAGPKIRDIMVEFWS